MTWVCNTLLVGALAALQITCADGATAAPVRGHTKSFKDCSACPEMIRIPGGRFLVGSPAADTDSDGMERPQRPVKIKAFAIGRYPVTKGEYAVFVAATHRPTEKGCSWTTRTKGDPDPLASWEETSFPQTPRDPIVCITWEDVNAYVNWLQRKTANRTGFQARRSGNMRREPEQRPVFPGAIRHRTSSPTMERSSLVP